MPAIDAVVLCTSAVPAIKPLSLMKTMATKVLPFVKTSRPSFKFPKNGTPEEVDWLGAKKQIDAAKAAGIKQFVFVSSMGGTNPDNFLNSIGRKKDGSGGDILLWKRKAERYLVESGVPYTIIHPGGLVDEDGSKRELVVGVNDEIMKDPDSPRAARAPSRGPTSRACARPRSGARRPAWRWTWSRRRRATARRRRTRGQCSHHPRGNTPTSPRRRTRRAGGCGGGELGHAAPHSKWDTAASEIRGTPPVVSLTLCRSFAMRSDLPDRLARSAKR